MDIRNYRQLKSFAEERLSQAGAYRRIVVIFAGITLGLSALMTLVDMGLSLQIGKSGGLGGMENRATLTAIQNFLPFVQTFVTLCMELGYLAAILRVARGQYVSVNTLRLGFDRLWVLVRVTLIQGLIFMGLGIASLYVAVMLFLATPLSGPVVELLTPLMEDSTVLSSGVLTLEGPVMDQLTQGLLPVSWLWLGLFSLGAIPIAYRLRMVSFVIIDKPGMGALAALRESRKMMRGNCVSLFLLDIKQWPYYLAMVLATVAGYGNFLLSLLGVSLPLSEEAAFLLFTALYLLLMFFLYVFLRGRVETVYALAYDSIRPEDKQDGAVLGNIFQM